MAKIGIAGIGMVGGALNKYFDNAYLYDKYKEIGSLTELNKADFIYICVPTPTTEKGCDISAVEEVVKGLTGKKIIIIKSTVKPGTTEKLQKKYPRVNWIRVDWRDGLPFKDNYFDYITAGEVIEHTENPREFLKELFRVLKKGGMIKLTTPYEEGYSRESCAPIEHIWGFNQQDIEQITGELGEHDVELVKDERDYTFLAAYIKK